MVWAVVTISFGISNIWLMRVMAGSGMGAAAVFERGDCGDELSNARKM